MKICLVSSCWMPTPPIKGGAIESQVYGLAKHLTDYCEEVHLVTINSSNIIEPLPKNMHIHKIKMLVKDPGTRGISTIGSSELQYAYKVSKLIRTLKVDIVHYNTPYPCLYGVMSNLKVPKIYHAHNWRAVENPRLRARDTLKKVVHKVGVNVDYYNVSNVDKTVAVSKFIRDGILSTVYVDDKKIIEIPNSVDTEMFYPNTENDEREKSVIFVGRISPEKGIDDLLKSMAIVIREVRDAKLIIVGPRKFGIEHGTYDSYLLKLVHKLDIEKHVDFKYQITYNELRRLYSSVEVCVLPAVWNEPFGLVLIESMACETAVIGTAVGGIPEIITNGVNGFLIKPKDIKQLAEAIVQSLSDTNLARKMGIRGRKLVKKRYVWKINVEKFYKVYEDVIGK